jgi:peptidoglycan/LPS O-acetylase OafA/YrhL
MPSQRQLAYKLLRDHGQDRTYSTARPIPSLQPSVPPRDKTSQQQATGILLDSKQKPHFYRRFYTRRALRILPAYCSLLILLLLLRTSSVAFVGLSFVYLANLTNFFGVACDYAPLWSVAVEEHFYILWPAVVRKVAMRRLALVSATIVVFVPLLRAVSFALGHWTRVD